MVETTRTSSRIGIASHLTAEDGDPGLISILPNELGQLIFSELIEYFSQPVSGAQTLLEHEALHIAGGIVQLAMRRQWNRGTPRTPP